MLILDLETRSKCNLLEEGAYKYALDPSTEIICIGYKLDDIEGCVEHSYDLPFFILQYMEGDGLVAAHNAQFDRLVWESCVPARPIAPGRWYCTSAQMRVNAMPGSLADASRALFGNSRKDVKGSALIKLLSIPREDGTFNKDPALIQEMKDYCLQDVRATDDIMRATRWMSQTEFRDYRNSETINGDGVCIDRLLATSATKYAGVEARELARRLSAVTNGDCTKHTQVQRIKQWVLSRVSEDVRAMMVVYQKDVKKYSLDKAIRQRILSANEEHIINLRADVAEVIQILDDGNKSSVSKFAKMVSLADNEDDRVRGAFVYAGASQTLRFASRGLQLHNFKRDCLSSDDAETLISTMLKDEPIPNTMLTLAKALRPAIVAEDDHMLIVGDWSSVEAIALPWLADSDEADARLDVFRKKEDIYLKTSDELSLNDRQLGKVVELSMGFGGAAGAFNAMAANYNVFVSPHRVKEIVKLWRNRNQWAETFWNALEKAAKRAIADPGEVFMAGRVSYQFYPDLIGGTLVGTLPGGTTIQYPKAKLEQVESEYGPRTNITALKANWKPAQGEKEWPRVTLWRGLLAENVTQAFCAALLRDAIDRALKQDFPVVAHVHDELVGEVHMREAEKAKDQLQQIMEETPSWAPNLPLTAKVTIMPRYGK